MKPLRRIRAAQAVADQAEHDVVGDQLAGIHHGLGLAAELGAARHRVAQQIAGRHLRHAVFGLQALRLRSLARTGRPQQYDPHHVDPDPPQKEALPYRKTRRTGKLGTALILRGRCHSQPESCLQQEQVRPMPSAKPRNAFYAQSGGVTAVINASACGVIETCRKHKNSIGKVYAGRHGIVGALTEDLIDTSKESAAAIRALRHTPVRRLRLGALQAEEVRGQPGAVRAADRSLQGARHRLFLLQRRRRFGRHLPEGLAARRHAAAIRSRRSTCRRPSTTICRSPTAVPGFGSVAKYVAVSIREAGFDVASMAKTSTKVFIMEVMGRHAGWIAAAGGLAAEKAGDAPHIILFPEITFDEEKFCARVKECVEKYGYCAVVVSEGVKNAEGKFLSDAGLRDAFGHAQLGGVAPVIAQLVKAKLNYKYHWAVADYLQRAARHIASKVDVEQAYAVGKAAVELALKGHNSVMPTIVRVADKPYKWKIGMAPLERGGEPGKNAAA